MTHRSIFRFLLPVTMQLREFDKAPSFINITPDWLFCRKTTRCNFSYPTPEWWGASRSCPGDSGRNLLWPLVPSHNTASVKFNQQAVFDAHPSKERDWIKTCNNLNQVNEIRLRVRLSLLPLTLKFGGGHLVPAEVDVIQLWLLGNQNCVAQKHRHDEEMMISSAMFASSQPATAVINNCQDRSCISETPESSWGPDKEVRTGRKKEESGIVDITAVWICVNNGISITMWSSWSGGSRLGASGDSVVSMKRLFCLLLLLTPGSGFGLGV